MENLYSGSIPNGLKRTNQIAFFFNLMAIFDHSDFTGLTFESTKEMGLSHSLLWSAWKEILRHKVHGYTDHRKRYCKKVHKPRKR